MHPRQLLHCWCYGCGLYGLALLSFSLDFFLLLPCSDARRFLADEEERAVDRLHHLIGTLWESILVGSLSSGFLHSWKVVELEKQGNDPRDGGSEQEAEWGWDSDASISDVTEDGYLSRD